MPFTCIFYGYRPESGERNNEMADFTPINTQEEFDAAIKERLKRDREAQSKKYEGWLSPEDQKKRAEEYEKQIKALQDAAAESEKAIAEKDAEIAKGAKYRTDLAKTRIALNAGLKIEYAERLMGENEDEWKKDAETLAKDFAAAHRTAPLGNPEGAPAEMTDKKAEENAGYRSLLSGLDASSK